jgi:hypothetical protein
MDKPILRQKYIRILRVGQLEGNRLRERESESWHILFQSGKIFYRTQPIVIILVFQARLDRRGGR